MSSSALIQDEGMTRVLTSFIKKLDAAVDPNHLELIPLKGGGSQASLYRFDLNNKSYVLRLLPPQSTHLTRKNQMMLASQAGNIGVGPKVHYVDTYLKGLIMEFIPGRTAQPGDFDHPDQMAAFAKFLKRLHFSKEHFPLACSPFQRFQNFIFKGEKGKITYPSRFAEVKTVMEELKAILQLNPIPLVPTHLDLHPLNIMLLNQRFFLVDWVNGGLSDPYFDLATFTTFQRFNEAQNAAFLTYYFEHAPTQFEWYRFIVMQPIRLLVIAAALLSTSIDASRSLSYEEALRSLDLPSLTDFGINETPLWHFGLTMLKEGLALIDKSDFKIALRHLQKHPL